MVQIIPAILATTKQEYEEKLSRIEQSGLFEDGWVQVDLMDEKFVRNRSIGPETVKEFSTRLKIEAQLMVEYPDDWVEGLIGANVKRIIFPIEDLSGVNERIRHIKNHGIEVGLSINPDTDLDLLSPFVSTIDTVLVMSVEPGFGGQEFLLQSIERVRQIKQKWDISIEVDGGISAAVAKSLIDAGADNLIVGSHLLEGDLDENLENLWESIQ